MGLEGKEEQFPLLWMLPFVIQSLERSVWVGRDDLESHFWPGAWGPQQQIGFRVTRLEAGLDPISSHPHSLTMQPIPKIECTKGPLEAPGLRTVLAFRPWSHLPVSICFSSFFPTAIYSSLFGAICVQMPRAWCPIFLVIFHVHSCWRGIVTNDCSA